MVSLEARRGREQGQEEVNKYSGVPTFSDIQAIAIDTGNVQQAAASDPDVSDPVGMYMGEINKPFLTNKQVRVLATAIQVGKVVGALREITDGRDEVATDGFVSPVVTRGFLAEINLGNSIKIEKKKSKKKNAAESNDSSIDEGSIDNGRETVTRFVLNTESPDSDSIRRQLKSIDQAFDTWQKNARVAKVIFIERYLRYVASMANHYVGRGMEYLDLIQEGNIGLEKAVDRFDPALVDNFIPYAKLWIRQAITRALANQSMAIRLPEHMFKKVNDLRRASSKLAVSYERMPTVRELAKEMGISVNEVREIERSGRINRGESFEELKEEGEGGLYYGMVGQQSSGPEEAAQISEQKRVVLEAVGQLGELHRRAIIYLYGLNGLVPQTMEQIGRELGYGRNRIGKIVKEAHEMLKQLLEKKLKDNPSSPAIV